MGRFPVRAHRIWMRYCRLAAAAATAAIAFPPSAAAQRFNLTISNARTNNVTCTGGVCMATAPGAVLNVETLQNLLAAADLKVTTGTQQDDITIAAPVTWSAATTLTLDSYHSIIIDHSMKDNGAGGLTLLTNDGGKRGALAFGPSGNVAFQALTNSLSINGTSYRLVGDIAALANSVTENPKGAYALAHDYDARQDGTYASTPIFTQFEGVFEGLGNQIANLSIKDTTPSDSVALFAFSVGTINDIGLTNVRITGPSGNSSQPPVIGGLAVVNNGAMRGDFVTGSIKAGDYAAIGGLVGVNEGVLSNSFSTASVAGGANAFAGGLAGSNNGGAILASYAGGSVTGDNVSYTGGLIGYNYGPALLSHATGAVSGGNSASVGGFVGSNGFVSNVRDCFASGTVSAGTSANIGGFAGVSGGSIDESFATGAVTGMNTVKIGGLVGFNVGVIYNSYALGSVGAENVSYAGGLVGFGQSTNTGNIHASYATGPVTAGASTLTGGFIGADENSFAALKHDYWDKTSSNITDPKNGTGNKSNDPGIKGLTTPRLQSALPAGFSNNIWGETPNINNGLPYLLGNLPPE